MATGDKDHPSPSASSAAAPSQPDETIAAQSPTVRRDDGAASSSALPPTPSGATAGAPARTHSLVGSMGGALHLPHAPRLLKKLSGSHGTSSGDNTPHTPDTVELGNESSVTIPNASTDFASVRETAAWISAMQEYEVVADKILGPLDEPREPTSGVSSFSPTDRLVIEMRSSLAKRRAILEQFLRARHGNVQHGSKMLSETLKWRATLDFSEYAEKHREFLEHPNALFPLRVLTDPSKGHKQAVVYGLLRMLDKRRIEKAPFQDAIIAFFEHLYFTQHYQVEPVTVIIDFRGWSIRRHTPYRVVRDGMQLLQDYYPDRLGRVFLVNYPSTMRAAYAALAPVIDAGAREKTVWVGEDPAETLAKYIPTNSLPVFLGGKLDVEFPGVDLVKEWNDPSSVETSFF